MPKARFHFLKCISEVISMYNLKNWNEMGSEADDLGILIDPDNPRESRLRVALAFHSLGRYREAIEAMTGEPSNEGENLRLFKSCGSGELKPRRFYEKIPEVDIQI
jgi:hypothetical protein